MATFYFDLASPLSYLAAERVLDVLPGPAEWQPVLMSELVRRDPSGSSADPSGSSSSDRELVRRDPSGSSSDPSGSSSAAREHVELRAELGSDALRAEIERRARALGLQPVRWPQPFPFDSTLAMRIATYARSIGRTVAFAQAAFRQAYAGGRNLEDADNVLIAAAACEMHPAAVLKAAELRSTDAELHRQTARAARAGVRALPAIVADEHVFAGDAALERAATHMRAGARAAASG